MILFLAPKEAIWIQMLYFRIFVRNYMETVSFPETNEYIDYDDGKNGHNFTYPFVALLNFDTLQCKQLTAW